MDKQTLVEATAKELKRLVEKEDCNYEKIVALLSTAKPCLRECVKPVYQDLLCQHMAKTLDYTAFVEKFLAE